MKNPTEFRVRAGVLAGIVLVLVAAFTTFGAQTRAQIPPAPPAPSAVGHGAEIEPNDSTATAQRLPYTPIRVRADLYRFPIGGGDVDIYSFVANAGDRVYAALMTGFSAGQTDTDLTLLAPDGVTVLEFDDDDGFVSDLASNIAGAVLPSAGTHYLRVRQKLPTLAGTVRSYDLYARVLSGSPTAEVEPNDYLISTNPLPANGWVSGVVAPGNDTDSFSVVANAGDTIVVIVDGDPERDAPDWNPGVAIAFFNGVGIAADGSAVGGSADANPSEAFFMTAKEAATYQIVVNDAAHAGSATFTYHLSVSVIPAETARTYITYEFPGPIPLADLGTSDILLTVSDAAIIDNLRVGLTIDHSNTLDLDVSLISPEGNEVVLFDNVLANGPPYTINLVLDDEAAIQIGAVVFAGGMRYSPASFSKLSYFKGMQAQGAWTLRIRDHTLGNTGSVIAWNLSVGTIPLRTSPLSAALFDFEASDQGFTHGGTQDEWAWGTPSSAPITTCHSGTKCWKTDLAGSYNAGSNQELSSPPMNLTGLESLTLTWWQKSQLDSASRHTAYVEIREFPTPTTSRRLWEWKGGRQSRTVGNPAVEVQISSGWSQMQADISDFSGKLVVFVVHLQSDNVTTQFAGLAIDDVEIRYGPNLLKNGSFTIGLTNWSPFATSTNYPAQAMDLNYIVHNDGAGEYLEFFRRPPASANNEAEMIQSSGSGVPESTALVAEFDAANTSPVRKRLSLLVYDANFSELFFCTFMLDANAPWRHFIMRTHTIQAWGNATIAFYAHSANAATDTGGYRLDNVSLAVAPGGSVTRTECEDPTHPTTGGLQDPSTILQSGSFGPQGPTPPAPWIALGQMTSQVNALGQFEMQKLSPVTPAQQYGVVYQPVPVPNHEVDNDQRIGATFMLGNSSAGRQRVKVVVSDLNFTDIAACNFYVPGGRLGGPGLYGMRTFATKAHASLTVSFYPVNPTGQWLLLDDVEMKRINNVVALGTECLEPGSSAPLGPDTGHGASLTWRIALKSEPSGLRGTTPIDLRAASTATLSFTSSLGRGKPAGEIQISLDGVHWTTYLKVPATDRPIFLSVNLSAFAGELVYVRFVFQGLGVGDDPSLWPVSDVRIEIGGLRQPSQRRR